MCITPPNHQQGVSYHCCITVGWQHNGWGGCWMHCHVQLLVLCCMWYRGIVMILH